ncbi:hypothetical protein SAMN05421663_104293 [Terribacillus halophilus]|uniref:Uncharacterized protein n=1 Tax=Terribacillus halophilus TaxID=361279 RepID=A0A1G6PY69_9BACI|nr:hypothetical protein [Terribacillus halophilus]SDC84604.1 hypothetical protein SAMN05421663_104293 [Terribacillus halophilus]
MGRRNIGEMDFWALRNSLDTRQSISSLGAMLIVSIFLNAILFLVVYIVVFDYSTYPNKESIYKAHLYITVILSLLSLIFGLPSVYKRFEKIQYLITIIVSQNLFGAFPLLFALFAFGNVYGVTQDDLLTITKLALFAGGLVFIVTSIRFFLLLKRGEYRADSYKEKVRKKWENFVRGKLPVFTAIGVGAVFIIQFLFRVIPLTDFDTIIMGTLSILIYLTMLFVLPEQLVILYCKIRYESFNHNRKGNLKPFGFKTHQKKKKKNYKVR